MHMRMKSKCINEVSVITKTKHNQTNKPFVTTHMITNDLNDAISLLPNLLQNPLKTLQSNDSNMLRECRVRSNLISKLSKSPLIFLKLMTKRIDIPDLPLIRPRCQDSIILFKLILELWFQRHVFFNEYSYLF